VESGSVDSTVKTIKAKHELVYAVLLHPDSPPPPPPPPSPPHPPLTPGYPFTSFCAKTENDSFLSNLRPLLFTDWLNDLYVLTLIPTGGADLAPPYRFLLITTKPLEFFSWNSLTFLYWIGETSLFSQNCFAAAAAAAAAAIFSNIKPEKITNDTIRIAIHWLFPNLVYWGS